VIYAANAAYLLMLGAFVTRDMLRLRALLACGQGLLMLFAWRSGVVSLAGWNALFLTINAAMAVRVLRERRAVRLPPDLQALHDRHFAALSPAEFLDWWGQGHRERLDGVALTRTGRWPEGLYFLLEGRVRVSRDDDAVVELPAGFFVGEMSLLTNRPASADVDALGPVEVMRWTRGDLLALREASPTLWVRIQSVLGYDLVEKVRVWELRSRGGA
jgi:hypothetical protein